MIHVRHVAIVVVSGLACASLSCSTNGRAPEAPPSRPILYQSQAPGGTEDLRVLAPETGISTVLLNGDSISARGLAAWGPDSQRVAYIREYGRRGELWILDIHSSAQRHLGDSLPAAVIFPDWSHDGRRIAVSAGATASHVGVFTIDPATGRAREVRVDAASYRCPSWAPDGGRLVVGAYAQQRSALLVLDTTGVVRDTLLKSDTTYLDCPQWSPRGDEILFTVFHGSGASGWSAQRSTAIWPFCRCGNERYGRSPPTTGLRTMAAGLRMDSGSSTKVTATLRQQRTPRTSDKCCRISKST